MRASNDCNETASRVILTALSSNLHARPQQSFVSKSSSCDAWCAVHAEASHDFFERSSCEASVISSIRVDVGSAAPPALARAMATARAIRASPQKDVS
eukprot:CAMPEP_0182814846 /NCGR_PEP_ID=MMETSP0006_2-20121128/10075_1 /TAXON_ID=97485 /ORGANISM="Prymnesium parvum, Strain Texoma1" /LENGTH=97 /DNA_ID=CAMNT_0024941005 /DNA_START=210 /DNA_END=504 /DNA_ORIENTATION=-